ncbi:MULTISPECIES: histidine phosphatase family protein [Nitrosomonas]|nr:MULTISPECIES: histidine phosphatase family protein [Nitrosomonas]TYP77408.1 putative phosphoglycerate mutase [Nitrosomonas communis]UVS60038.1 histidine phosphatase family protein [Nitrosomonas sp. PLL12]
MRHRRTNYNDLGLCNYDPNRDVHLTKVGIEQEQEQAHSAALTLRHVAFERIVVSPLTRT